MPNQAHTYASCDRITLTGVAAVGFHGALDFEKREGQPFIVDTVLYTDFTQAAATDDLTQTTNYAEVAEIIRTHIVGESLDLIETLAVRIAQNILDECAYVHALEVTVNKPKAPIEVTFGNVAVTVFREREGTQSQGGKGAGARG